MILRVFLFLAITLFIVALAQNNTQQADGEEEETECIQQITNCTDTYSTRLDSEVLFDFYSCIVTISTCDETQDLVYRQTIMKKIVDTMRQIKADEQYKKRREESGESDSAGQPAWSIWNIVFPIAVFWVFYISKHDFILSSVI